MPSSPWNYVLWMFGFLWLPTVLLWLFNIGGVRRHLKNVVASAFLITAMCVSVEYFIVRDVLIMHRGHYLGLYLFGAPIEDTIFFFSVPFLLAPIALKTQELLDGEAC